MVTEEQGNFKEFDFRQLLNHYRKKTISFSEWLDDFMANPGNHLHTSSTLISEAVKFFGYRIVIRSGEPTISYNIFNDPFAKGINAVFGQEFCIKHIVDVIESVGKESGPNRGIILVGPPASGKTNIIDLISLALEEYSNQDNVRLYTFYFQFGNDDNHDDKRTVELHCSFMHNPILLIPTILQLDGRIIRPRQQLFEQINKLRDPYKEVLFPTYYQNATLDKRNLDILESLMQHPRNRDKPLSEIIDTYVRIEEIEFSNAQARGIANIDTMESLQMGLQPLKMGQKALDIINQHLPSHFLYNYTGAIIAANRGILHIHDAFGSSVGSSQPGDLEYKPLLMLLGSGRVSCEATQASVDNTVVITTNIEEMARLETHLTSSKLLDRIEKVPVNYLLDTNSEMDILRRDLSLMHEKFDVDPNLLRLAAYFSVLTRLLPPLREKFPPQWSKEKVELYKAVTPEQKLFIYSCQAEDPAGTIRRLPHWHPFRNEAVRLGLDIGDQEELNCLLFHRHEAVHLESSGVFSREQLQLIDDEFMRLLWNEHFPNEGQHGISVRQLQNIMRDTIAASDGRKIHVGTLFSQLQRIVAEGHALHHWLTIDQSYKRDRNPLAPRRIGAKNFNKGSGDYGDYPGCLEIAQALYFEIIRREITVATVDRDPKLIECDLRRYLQNILLARAVSNQAFAHIMVPRYSFVDPDTGEKVERPDLIYMSSIEKIIAQGKIAATTRNQLAEKFLQLQSSGELVIEEGKNIINSRDDNLISCFVAEYNHLLSHRKPVEGINLDELNEAFFQKRNAPDKYINYSLEIRNLVEIILNNLTIRYRYSQSLALDTVVFALHKEIINFREIIT